MDELTLLTALHQDNERQGPGGDDETRLAITLAGLRGRRGLRIADIGCGTGASARVLAQELDACITAVDFLPAFLERLTQRAAAQGIADRIEVLAGTMDELAFGESSLDAIWAEGAIYNMGFTKGVRAWRRFLKPGGILAVSELTWLTAERPKELNSHWMELYPEVATAATKMAILEDNGYAPVGYFTLPERCWLENYYRPLQACFPAFLERCGHAEAARGIVAEEEREIALYERYREFVSYGFYVARRIGP